MHNNAATETSGAVSNSRPQLSRVPFGSELLSNATRCGGFVAGSNGLLQDTTVSRSTKSHQEVELERSLPQNLTLSFRLSDWYLTGMDSWEQLVVLRPNEVAFQTHLGTRSKVILTVAVEFNISEPDQEDPTEIFGTFFVHDIPASFVGNSAGNKE